jgi:hypothetical protein
VVAIGSIGNDIAGLLKRLLDFLDLSCRGVESQGNTKIKLPVNTVAGRESSIAGKNVLGYVNDK